MNNKVCLITHIADLDGCFPIILLRKCYEDYDIFSCEVGEVDDTLNKVLESKIDYKNIYIVDLNISDDLALKIENSNLKNIIKVFDHHESKIEMNKYSFIKVVVKSDKHYECGTTLFYEYLNSLFNLKSNLLDYMVELVRELDTFDFKEENKDNSFKLGNLYKIYGREEFINHYLNFINNNEVFKFSEIELELLKVEEDRINRYIKEKLENVIFDTINNKSVGIVFAEQNKSLLGQEMCKTFDIDIAIIINVDRSISYRSIKDDADVSLFASIYNGGGHFHASGSSIPVDLKTKIIDYIFKNI